MIIFRRHFAGIINIGHTIVSTERSHNSDEQQTIIKAGLFLSQRVDVLQHVRGGGSDDTHVLRLFLNFSAVIHKQMGMRVEL